MSIHRQHQQKAPSFRIKAQGTNTKKQNDTSNSIQKNCLTWQFHVYMGLILWDKIFSQTIRILHKDFYIYLCGLNFLSSHEEYDNFIIGYRSDARVLQKLNDYYHRELNRQKRDKRYQMRAYAVEPNGSLERVINHPPIH